MMMEMQPPIRSTSALTKVPRTSISNTASFRLGSLKSIPVTEKMRVQFRAEAFNVLNRVNFANPNNNRSSPTFGVITSAVDPRVLQMALKFMF
jgi:hypothetical protein